MGGPAPVAELGDLDTPAVTVSAGSASCRPALRWANAGAGRCPARSAQGAPVSLSIGLAEPGQGLNTVKAWTAAADAALYRAKLAGRGCVRD